MATARCSAYCVIAQRFSIQPLGSLRWPAAEQKHTPQVYVADVAESVVLDFQHHLLSLSFDSEAFSMSHSAFLLAPTL